MSLSVVIAVKNEEAGIERCISAVEWADEVVVVDDMSTDRTVELCRSKGAKVFINDSRGSFHGNKNLGLEKAGCDWVLSLDADEVVDEVLAGEVRRVVKADDPRMLGYRVNRRNYFLGRWVRGCGWYPDHIIRLFRKGAAVWPLEIHDVPAIAEEARVGVLAGHLDHHSYGTMDQYMRKLAQYTAKLAEEQWDRGRRVTPFNFGLYFIIRPLYWFLKKYFLQQGFRDGFRGYFICVSSAITIFFMYTRLWALQQSRRG